MYFFSVFSLCNYLSSLTSMFSTPPVVGRDVMYSTHTRSHVQSPGGCMYLRMCMRLMYVYKVPYILQAAYLYLSTSSSQPGNCFPFISQPWINRRRCVPHCSTFFLPFRRARQCKHNEAIHVKIPTYRLTFSTLHLRPVFPRHPSLWPLPLLRQKPFHLPPFNSSAAREHSVH